MRRIASAVQPELLRGLVDQRLERRGDLILTGAALRARRRRVRADLHAAIAHRERLIDQRDRARRAAEIAAAVVRPVLLNDVEIGGRHAAVGAEADLDAALERRTRRAEQRLLGAAHAHHHRHAGLLRHVDRHAHRRIRIDLRAEAAAAEFRDVDDVVGLDARKPREVRHDGGLALRRAVDEHLVALPIRHAGARLEAVMRQRRRDERLVEHVLRARESCVHVAERPLDAGRTHRQRIAGLEKSLAVHLIDFTPCCVTALPSLRASGPAGNRLASGSMTYGNSSYSTLMRSIASCASSSLRAATARMRSPTKSGSFVRIGSAGAVAGGTSSAVSTATTPSIASASVASILTRACGIVLVSRRQNSMPSARKSSAYLARPVTLAQIGRREILTEKRVSHELFPLRHGVKRPGVVAVDSATDTRRLQAARARHGSDRQTAVSATALGSNRSACTAACGSRR